MIAKFHRTDLIICSHSREGKSPSNGQINTVFSFWLLKGLTSFFLKNFIIVSRIHTFSLNIVVHY